MKTRLLLVLVLLLVGAFTVSAQSDGRTYGSGVVVQNLDDVNDASVTFSFYAEEDGNNANDPAVFTVTVTIPAGEAKGFFIPTDPNFAGLPANFRGAAVLSSNRPIAATLNTGTAEGDRGTSDTKPHRDGTASGVGNPATKLFVTQVLQNAYQYVTGYDYDSYIAVQNTDSTDDATVTVSYKDASGAAAGSVTKTISPFRNAIIKPSDSDGISDAQEFIGSATVESTQPVAAVFAFFNSGSATATSQFNSTNAISESGTKVYVPRLLKQYYGYNSGMKAQNAGTAATDILVTYTFNGVEYTETFANIQPGAAGEVYLGSAGPAGIPGGPTGRGTAVITADQPLVVTANEDGAETSDPNERGKAVTYNGVLTGTDVLVFPQVTSRFYGRSGGFQIMCIGPAACDVHMEWTGDGTLGSNETFAETVNGVAVNGQIERFAPDVLSNPNWSGSIVATCTNGNSIIGIANFGYRADYSAGDSWYGVPNYGDSYIQYNGISK